LGSQVNANWGNECKFSGIVAPIFYLTQLGQYGHLDIISS